MTPITEAKDLQGKRVLVRVDWNVPIQDGKVLDDYRIRVSLETLDYLKSAGAKIILATHLGEGESTETLKAYVPEGAELLPNLRENPGEESNSEEFAQELASKADIYVNEAFSVSHREHASIVGVPKLLPHYTGIQFMREVENLSKAFNPEHPFLLLLGGAKLETKLPLVEKFLGIADEVFIGGVMAKTAQEEGLDKNPKIVLPLGDIEALDADDENINMLREKISGSKFVIWNGPLGKYEEGYVEGAKKLAQALADSSAEVIIGGGDTLAAIKGLDILDKFSFISTGGGAMLTFLATETLPGIEVLE